MARFELWMVDPSSLSCIPDCSYGPIELGPIVLGFVVSILATSLLVSFVG